jgi:hypothetical protein
MTNQTIHPYQFTTANLQDVAARIGKKANVDTSHLKHPIDPELIAACTRYLNAPNQDWDTDVEEEKHHAHAEIRLRAALIQNSVTLDLVGDSPAAFKRTACRHCGGVGDAARFRV